MEDLIKALQIFLKYGNPVNPTHCEHDVMYICGIDCEKITAEDEAELGRLGFFYDESDDGYHSFKFGSA